MDDPGLLVVDILGWVLILALAVGGMLFGGEVARLEEQKRVREALKRAKDGSP